MEKVLFIYSNHRNWIIGAIFKEIESIAPFKIWKNYFPETRRQKFKLQNLSSHFFPKKGDKNIFATHKLFFKFGDKRDYSKVRVFVTQIFDEVDFALNRNISLLNTCERVIVQNTNLKNFLIDCGVKKEIIFTFPGAINRQIFFPSVDYDPYILISGDMKDRKNPQGIIDLVLANKDLQFKIHGKNLNIFNQLTLESAKNVDLIPWNFSRQPTLMRQASVYVSLSKMEGGPFSILEALSSGTPVVTTDVGIANDLIKEGNGFILPIMYDPIELSNKIKKAIKLKPKTAGRDLLGGKFTWEEYSDIFFGD